MNRAAQKPALGEDFLFVALLANGPGVEGFPGRAVGRLHGNKALIRRGDERFADLAQNCFFVAERALQGRQSALSFVESVNGEDEAGHGRQKAPRRKSGGAVHDSQRRT